MTSCGLHRALIREEAAQFPMLSRGKEVGIASDQQRRHELFTKFCFVKYLNAMDGHLKIVGCEALCLFGFICCNRRIAVTQGIQ